MYNSIWIEMYRRLLAKTAYLLGSLRLVHRVMSRRYTVVSQLADFKAVRAGLA
jgi:hypothetical protein